MLCGVPPCYFGKKGGIAVGRTRKYNDASLYKGVREYFDSISTLVPATVEKPCVEDDGSVTMKNFLAKDGQGNVIRKRVFVGVPSVEGLARFLNIHRDTWDSYRRDGEYKDAVDLFYSTYKAYLNTELIMGSGYKAVQGVIFTIQNIVGAEEKEKNGDGMSLEEFLQDESQGL